MPERPAWRAGTTAAPSRKARHPCPAAGAPGLHRGHVQGALWAGIENEHFQVLGPRRGARRALVQCVTYVAECAAAARWRRAYRAGCPSAPAGGGGMAAHNSMRAAARAAPDRSRAACAPRPRVMPDPCLMAAPSAAGRKSGGWGGGNGIAQCASGGVPAGWIRPAARVRKPPLQTCTRGRSWIVRYRRALQGRAAGVPARRTGAPALRSKRLAGGNHGKTSAHIKYWGAR